MARSRIIGWSGACALWLASPAIVACGIAAFVGTIYEDNATFPQGYLSYRSLQTGDEGWKRLERWGIQLGGTDYLASWWDAPYGWQVFFGADLTSLPSTEFLGAGEVVTRAGPVELCGFGWPFVCMEGVAWGRSGKIWEPYSRLEAGSSWSIPVVMGTNDAMLNPGYIGRVIPLYPVAWAYAANLATYGMSCFLVVEISRRARNIFRRSRNRCMGCGYPINGLDGSVCPECGKGRPGA